MMAEEEKQDSTEQEEPQAEEPQAEEAAAEEAPAEEPQAEEAPAKEAEAEAPAAEEPEPEEDPEADLPWKQRRRLERSRRPSEAGPQRSAEERATQRREERRAKAVARRRYRQAKRAKRGEPGTGTPTAERSPNPPKVRQGVVVSDRADKTITVRIDIARRHPAYEKIVRRSRRLHAHDERNEAGQGDLVRVVETRPLSRTKRWRLLEVVQKAE